MCIIVYKPKDIDMPSKETLLRCFNKNKDGAGYMYTNNDRVYISKGYTNFDDFYRNLMEFYSNNHNIPFVMHFRIGTSGGYGEGVTHPFPLSRDINVLTTLDLSCQIGIAHNGIISLANDYKDCKMSDTMHFIQDYLALIIKYIDYYNKDDTITLIKRLIGNYNKLAIMSCDGHVELIGDFIEDNGCYYSNRTYEDDEINRSYLDDKDKNYFKDDLDWLYEWDKYYDDYLKSYDFDDTYCPRLICDNHSYCCDCLYKHQCKILKKEK